MTPADYPVLVPDGMHVRFTMHRVLEILATEGDTCTGAGLGERIVARRDALRRCGLADGAVYVAVCAEQLPAQPFYAARTYLVVRTPPADIADFIAGGLVAAGSPFLTAADIRYFERPHDAKDKHTPLSL